MSEYLRTLISRCFMPRLQKKARMRILWVWSIGHRANILIPQTSSKHHQHQPPWTDFLSLTIVTGNYHRPTHRNPPTSTRPADPSPPPDSRRVFFWFWETYMCCYCCKWVEMSTAPSEQMNRSMAFDIPRVNFFFRHNLPPAEPIECESIGARAKIPRPSVFCLP